MSDAEMKTDSANDKSSQEPEVKEETGTANDPVAELEARLAEAEARAEENWDLLVRTKAEMENQRRRNQQEIEKARKFALEKFVNELLPIFDSLEMGLAAAQSEDASIEKVIEGTELTLKMFQSAMDKFDIVAVNPLDEPFNPEHHQAMSMVEVPGKPANTVINVMQKGYLLNDRLVRPAMVVVSKAPAAPAEEKGTNLDEEA